MTARPRLIPTISIRNGSLVKTVRFRDEKYVGDPINAVRIFNEKEADELLVIDIGATVNGVPPDFQTIRILASECRMPLTYAGGVTSSQHVDRLISIGVEKVGLSNAAIADPDLVLQCASLVGRQSIAVILDVRELDSDYFVFTHNAKRSTDLSVRKALDIFQDHGAGEIIVNSINRDGTMSGFDRTLIRQCMDRTSVPITAIGGAASLEDCGGLAHEFGSMGIGAGSLFLFKGRFRAVLISYPSLSERVDMFKETSKTYHDDRV